MNLSNEKLQINAKSNTHLIKWIANLEGNLSSVQNVYHSFIQLIESLSTTHEHILRELNQMKEFLNEQTEAEEK